MADANSPSGRIPRRIAARAIVKQALPFGIASILVAEFTGYLPPWPVCTSLFLGGLTALAFHAINRNYVGNVISGVTALICFALLWPRVDIRPATAHDNNYNQYFGGPFPPADFTARNIAVAEGAFTLDTWLTMQLFHVHNGRIRELNGNVIGRTPNRVPALHWRDMSLTLALVTWDTKNGSVTQLGAAGHTRGGGSGNGLPTSVTARHWRLSAGRLLWGQSRILYVEGDSQFSLSPNMTVESFAQANTGSFYVMVVGLE